MHSWFSVEVAVLRRILKTMPLLLLGGLATGCSAAEDLTGPVAPPAAFATAYRSPAISVSGSERSDQTPQLNSRRRRGTRYAMGAN